MKDIIRLAGSPPTYNNTSNQRGSGLELEMSWDVSRSLRVSGNYSFQRSIDEASDRDAGYAPHQHLFLRADWQFASGMACNLQLNHVADRRRAPGDTRPAVPDYTTLDVALRTQKLVNHWDFALTLRNLIDADVRQPSLYSPAPALRPDLPTSQIPDDLPMAGRTLQLQASYRF